MPARAEQTFTGKISDSMCGASHRASPSTSLGAGELTDRQCLLACIGALAKYVLVDRNDRVLPIANQDAMGLPLYAGRPVKLTGEWKGDAIFVTRVEAIPAHLHIGHVMTNWRDTPGARGFLPVAVDEARVAALHARLEIGKHTSELQSQFHLVCRLLLEKKKNSRTSRPSGAWRAARAPRRAQSTRSGP